MLRKWQACAQNSSSLQRQQSFAVPLRLRQAGRGKAGAQTWISAAQHCPWGAAEVSRAGPHLQQIRQGSVPCVHSEPWSLPAWSQVLCSIPLPFSYPKNWLPFPSPAPKQLFPLGIPWCMACCRDLLSQSLSCPSARPLSGWSSALSQLILPPVCSQQTPWGGSACILQHSAAEGVLLAGQLMQPAAAFTPLSLNSSLVVLSPGTPPECLHLGWGSQLKRLRISDSEVTGLKLRFPFRIPACER